MKPGVEAWEALAEWLLGERGWRLDRDSPREQGGGCIHSSWLARAETAGAGGGLRLFVKWNEAGCLEQFHAEAEGLAAISAAGALRTPRPWGCGLAGGLAFLAMEGLALEPLSGPGTERELGRRLAALHRTTSGDGRHGWERDNWIGSTPQPNGPEESWAEFFARRRLGWQLELAEARGRRFARAGEILDRAREMLGDWRPAPSLLHGDFWHGNAGRDAETGEPVVFDPAPYHGDRETDLAFSRLFSGFGSAFYQGYAEAWPVEPGHRERSELYNLYHVLNHWNLFGGGYGVQAEAMMERLLRR